MTRQCYIAGPMRGYKEYNYPEFMRVAEMLRDFGYLVFNPAEMDIEKDTTDYTKRTLKQQQQYDTAVAARRFSKRDVGIILDNLRMENGDFVVVLSGWEDSKGAQAEVALARWLMLPVLTEFQVVRST